MEETYITKAIVLTRQSFREYDSRVTLYSADRGKLELVARGTKKLGSKLAAHLEPISLSATMVVRGRQFDYVGGAAMEDGFGNIKSDLDRLISAGRVMRITNAVIKSGIDDREIFNLLDEVLRILDSPAALSAPAGLLSYFYAFKLAARLGYRPELTSCIRCGREILADNNYFDAKEGGIVCLKCNRHRSQFRLTISPESVKVLRFISDHDLSALGSLSLPNIVQQEIVNIVSSFIKYHLNQELD